jgi:hypothetical protein
VDGTLLVWAQGVSCRPEAVKDRVSTWSMVRHREREICCHWGNMLEHTARLRHPCIAERSRPFTRSVLQVLLNQVLHKGARGLAVCWTCRHVMGSVHQQGVHQRVLAMRVMVTFWSQKDHVRKYSLFSTVDQARDDKTQVCARFYRTV